MDAPLAGVRVLDLTHTIAGLCCTMLLGDLGAEVIKIEQREEGLKGVGARRANPYSVDGVDMRFIFLNRNKKGLTLDLKNPAGKDVFYRLVGKSDVVVDNFRPAVLDRLAIDYPKLKQINPGIISCSVSGYNPQGPYRDLPAFDPITMGMSGHSSLLRQPGGDPILAPFFLADVSAGVFAALGALTALYERATKGEGQKVHLSLLATALFYHFYQGVHFLNSGIPPEPWGREAPSTCMGIFKTRDSYIALTATTEGQFQALCRLIGEEHLIKDPRFVNRVVRIENRHELNMLVEARLQENDTSFWLEAIKNADIPVGPINTMAEAFADPRVQAEGMVAEVSYAGRTWKILENPVRLSAHPDAAFRSPPKMGEHSEEILSGLLSLSREEIEELRRKGAV